MKKIILHIGPGKCGSSSIQSFLLTNKKPCQEKVCFMLMKIKDINRLNVEELSADLTLYYEAFLKKCIKKHDVLILSHEYLFQCPLAIKQLCFLSAKLLMESRIIGYSRRQSDFIISAYAQWMFRSKDVIEEVNNTLLTNNIKPVLFDGLEKTIIAAINVDFKIAKSLFKINIFNWYESYNRIKTLTSNYNASIKCGSLPKLHDRVNLIEDFCLKANITLKDSYKPKTKVRENTKFHPLLVEALHNAVFYNDSVLDIHSDNDVLISISNIMSKLELESSELNENDFVLSLKNYVDSYFLESNQLFCREFDINVKYFELEKEIKKDFILNYIREEEQKRETGQTTIENYKKMSAELATTCLQLMKPNSK